MKSLHLIKTAVGAGWALLQITELVRKGVEVHIILGEEGPMRSAYERAGAHVHVSPIDIARLRDPMRLQSALKAFRALLLMIKPDVVHSHFVGTTLFMRLAMGGQYKIPRIFQVPGPMHMEYLATRCADIYSASKYDYWIATCKFTFDMYKKAGISDDRVFLSFQGTIVDPPRDESAFDLRQELGLTKDSEIVGLVAYIYSPKRWLGQRRGIKGHEDLIDAIEIISQTGRNVYGVFVGGAWGSDTRYEAEVRRYSEKKIGKRGIFLGTRTDVRRIYPNFNLVVHPSHSENFGGATESLVLGIPTVATNVGGFPDIVHDRVTGRLVPPKNPERLAQVITEALDDPEGGQIMARAGQELTRRVLDVRQTSSEVLECYRKVLAHCARAGSV